MQRSHIEQLIYFYNNIKCVQEEYFNCANYRCTSATLGAVLRALDNPSFRRSSNNSWRATARSSLTSLSSAITIHS